MADLRGRYRGLAVTLVIVGIALTAEAQLLLHAVPLVALGTATSILGVVLIGLDRALTARPAGLDGLLAEAGSATLASLIEETGVETPATYLPSSYLSDGKPRALLRLTQLGALPSPPLPARLIVPTDASVGELGMLVPTVGSFALDLLAEAPGPTIVELEAMAEEILVANLRVAAAVSFWPQAEDVRIEVQGVPLAAPMAYERVLGSPIASILAALIAEGSKQPVVIEAETRERSNLTVRVSLR